MKILKTTNTLKLRLQTFVLAFFWILFGCTTAIEKPKKLIDKDKMVDILYDMALLEAVKSQNINGGLSTKKANEFLFKKYQIDSLQWEENNKYYASDIEEYKEMYEAVKKRIQEETQKANTTSPQSAPASNSEEPMVK